MPLGHPMLCCKNNDPHLEQGTLWWAPFWPMRYIRDQSCNEYEEPHQDQKREEALNRKQKHENNENKGLKANRGQNPLRR